MFAIIENGSVAAYPIDPRAHFPRMSFPAVLTAECLPEGCVMVAATNVPTVGPLQNLTEGSPSLQNGQWVQTWVVETVAGDAAVERLQSLKERLCEQVNRDRDARIDSGFAFNGQTYQSRPSDRENVAGAAQAAFMAKASGAQPGNLRWANPDQDFVWIAANNVLVPMDVDTVIALFQAGVAFKSALTFYARSLKDAILASEDPQAVYDAATWPE